MSDTEDLPPELQQLAAHLGRQKPAVRDLVHYAFALMMIDDEKAHVIRTRNENAREYLDEPNGPHALSVTLPARAPWIQIGLLILLAFSFIACSPNLAPAPTADPSLLRTALAASASATDAALATLAALSAAKTSPATDTPAPIPTSPPTAPTAAPDSSANPPISQRLGQRTKMSGCVPANGLPDPDCTPGAIFADATADKICVSGYSKSVRDVPTSEKDQAYAEYGITTHAPGQYEVDHLISLELGGSNDIANLFPEAAEPRPGFHEKDQVENWLHEQVCKGNMPLTSAQIGIARNWLQFYAQARTDALAPTVAPALPATAAPAPTGHRFVASSQAKTYYYCETDPQWRELKATLIWSDDPATFTAKGLVLHRPC